MSSKTKRLLATAATASMILAAMTGASAEDGPPVPATETLYISAGCPSDDGATCTSIRWLGTETGDASSNFLTSTTPVDEVFYRVDGSINWRDYPSDSTLRAGGYPLRTDEDIIVSVNVQSNALTANNTVHAYLEARRADTNQLVRWDPQNTTVTVLPQSDETVSIPFEIPEALDGVALSRMTAYISVHGVNAQGGYINQQGRSTVEIPYWEPADS